MSSQERTVVDVAWPAKALRVEAAFMTFVALVIAVGLVAYVWLIFSPPIRLAAVMALDTNWVVLGLVLVPIGVAVVLIVLLLARIGWCLHRLAGAHRSDEQETDEW